MSKDELNLLLTVARLFRVHLRGGTEGYEAEDVTSMDDALRPWECLTDAAADDGCADE